MEVQYFKEVQYYTIGGVLCQFSVADGNKLKVYTVKLHVITEISKQKVEANNPRKQIKRNHNI